MFQFAMVVGLALASMYTSSVPGNVVEQFFFFSPLNDISLVGPLWTVSAEMHFYFVSILLCTLIVHLQSQLMLVTAFCFSILIATIYIYWTGDIVQQPRTFVGNLPFFMFGLILSTGQFNCGRLLQPLMKLVFVLGAIIVAWGLNNWGRSYFWGLGVLSDVVPVIGRVPIGGGAICALFISGVVLCTQVKRSPGKLASFTLNQFASCGFYTYGIYVFHALIIQLNRHIFGIPTGWGLLLLLMLAVPLSRCPAVLRFLSPY